MPNRSEAERLEALRRLNLLDTADNEAYDRITRLASRLFDVPVALISLIDEDRQWFKSRVGVDVRETPREQAFCDYTMRSDKVMVVPDATQDPRFRDNPLVTGAMNIRFYAGAPLITREGYGLGSLCVIDTKPRTLSPEDQQVLKDLSTMVMAHIDMRHAAGHIDAFSTLPNRNQLFEDLEDLASDNANQPHVLMVIDLISPQKAEEIVRILGPIHGDALIRESARLARENLGADTKLYHLDSARYVCLFRETGEHESQVAVDRLSACFAQPISCDGIPVDVDLSIGVQRFLPGEAKGPDLVRLAVMAAFDARETGRRSAAYDAETDKLRSRAFNLLTDIRQALESPDQLRLVYQPRVDMDINRCASVEALLRWQHPVLGPVSPGEFIPLVEQTGLTQSLTEWVMKNAIAQARRWQEEGIDLRVSINISARNLEEPDFIQRLEREVTRQGVPPQRIELEFTESALMKNAAAVLERLRAISDLGFEIAIDDFGSGYSNLNYVQNLPARIVKIDQSLVRDLTTNKRNRIIVRAIIGMMHDLDYRVVAEGIENRLVYEQLAVWGCNEAQGYFIAKPLESAALVGWLESRRNGAAEAEGRAPVENRAS